MKTCKAARTVPDEGHVKMGTLFQDLAPWRVFLVEGARPGSWSAGAWGLFRGRQAASGGLWSRDCDTISSVFGSCVNLIRGACSPLSCCVGQAWPGAAGWVGLRSLALSSDQLGAFDALVHNCHSFQGQSYSGTVKPRGWANPAGKLGSRETGDASAFPELAGEGGEWNWL